jgi:hypothetical protein
MTDLLTTPELAREPVKEPAKRWFNWWFSHGQSDNGPWRCGDQSNPQHDPTPYPSKDAAETVANAQFEKMRVDQGPWLLTYLGAYPEGERP